MHDVPLYIDTVSKLFVLFGTVYSLVYFFIFILEHLLYETILMHAVCFSWQPIPISALFSLNVLHAYRQTYICTVWYNTFASILPLLNSIMQSSNIWESMIVCSCYLHFLSVLFICIMSPLLSTLLSETFQACVPYFILTFLIHSSTIIWFISHISVHLLFISLYLCHYRLCLVLFHIFSHTATFDLFISLCTYITSSFWSLPILLCSKIPLAIFLSLVSLLYVKLVLHMALLSISLLLQTFLASALLCIFLVSLFMQALSYPQQCCQRVRSSEK